MASSILKQFARSPRGNVGIILGLSLVPIMLAGGGALDYLRASTAREHLQVALDAGALAAAVSSTSLKPAQRIQHGEEVFDSNWKDASIAGIDAKGRYKFVNGGVKGVAEAESPTLVMTAFGFDRITLNVESFVKIPEPKKAEIAMALDYSGSMQWAVGGKVKYVSMKDAAIRLVEDLADSAKGRVKFGLVPFSHHVRTTLPRGMIAGLSGPGYWTGCTQDRPYPHNVTDAAPGKDDETRWGQLQAPAHMSDDCNGYAPRHLTIAPLTDDNKAITHQLDAMRPYAWTHIALGAEFAWHLLSPGSPFDEGAPLDDKGTKKYMVLLTDGAQTEEAFGPGGSRTVHDGELNLKKICQKAKDQGITIMTIAFGVEDDATRGRLQDCASDPKKNYFEAESGGDIASAFELIKSQIAQQAFISE